MIRIFLALSSAMLLVLCFPNFDFGFLAWIALVPLILAIRDMSLKSALALSWVSGIVFFMGVFFWINAVKGVTLLHFSIMGMYLSLYFLVFGFLLRVIYKRRFAFVITAPALWVSVEYLRSHVGDFGLPLALLGHTQHQNLPLIQMSTFTGVYGVSFLIVMANAAIADVIAHFASPSPPSGHGREGFALNPLYRGLFVLAVILTIWGNGWQTLRQDPSGKPLSIAVVQGNIPQERKWKREFREQIISRYEALSEEAARSVPQLIVWPEASTPGFILSDLSLYQRMAKTVGGLHTYFLVGSSEYPKFGRKMIKLKSGNTALFFSPEGKLLGQYLKIRLVPFGEYVPYDGIVPWPEFLVRKDTQSDLAGTDLILFELDGIRLSAPICSEMMYPELSRGMVKKGAGFLVNISNEGWFGKSSFPYQFLSVCVFRAVENRVNVVRCTNTGVSCFIDPYGRIAAKVINEGHDIFVEGTLTREIFLSPPGAFYTRHGDIFAYACIVFTVGLVMWSSPRGRTRLSQKT